MLGWTSLERSTDTSSVNGGFKWFTYYKLGLLNLLLLLVFPHHFYHHHMPLLLHSYSLLDYFFCVIAVVVVEVVVVAVAMLWSIMRLFCSCKMCCFVPAVAITFVVLVVVYPDNFVNASKLVSLVLLFVRTLVVGSNLYITTTGSPSNCYLSSFS